MQFVRFCDQSRVMDKVGLFARRHGVTPSGLVDIDIKGSNPASSITP